MTRWKASAIHLSLSILVLGTIAAILVWRWYPPGLFHMAQADRLLVLLGGVDAVLGPLLTLIVFKQGKKSLKFDLTAIALMQVAALGYGLYTIWESRPVYLVASAHVVDVVFANELDPADLAAAPAEYRQLPLLGPRTVGVIVPTDPAEREKLMDLALAGKDLQFLPAHYRPYSDVSATLLGNARPIAPILERLPASGRDTFATAIRSTGRPEKELLAIPLASSRGIAAMLLDKENGALLRPVAVELPGI